MQHYISDRIEPKMKFHNTLYPFHQDGNSSMAMIF